MTASITMLPEITRRIRPPRALAVPFPLGFPLGQADNAPLQRAVLRSLLALCTDTAVPLIRDFDESRPLTDGLGATLQPSGSRP